MSLSLCLSHTEAQHSYTYVNLKKKSKLVGHEDGSIGKGVCYTFWDPEFDPGKP